MREEKIVHFKDSRNSVVWKSVTDGVMGGISTSFASVDNGILHFTGHVSLENNGGFAMIRSKREPIATAGFNGFALRVKGDGKRYQFRIKEKTEQRHSHIHHFETDTDWQTICILFQSMKPWFRGTHLDMDNFNGSQVSSIAFLIGNKTEESFHLQIESISLVNQ